jgi:intraflagellar transport protein 140
VVWGAKEVAIYELVKEGSVLRAANSFKCEATTCALHTSSVYTATEGHIDARAYNGASKQLMTFEKSEGMVTHMACTGDHLVAATDTGCLRTWDLSRREARLAAVRGCSLIFLLV